MEEDWMDYLKELEKHLEKYPDLHRLFLTHKVFIRYFITSFLSLAFEIGLVYLLFIYGGMEIFWSNVLGMTADFIFTYFFSKYVFDSDYDQKGFLLYLGTSILGMALNTWILTGSLAYFKPRLGKKPAFWLGKIFATGIPFFLKYFIRKYYFFLKKRKK